MHSLQRLVAASALLVMTACASSTVQRVGTAAYAPLPPNADVAVYTAESQIGRPFQLVATINYVDPGKFQILSLTDVYPPLKDRAREVGANAIIIDSSSPVISGAISRGIAVDARAVYVGSPVTITPIPPGQMPGAASPGPTISPASMPPPGPLPPAPSPAAQTAPAPQGQPNNASPGQGKDPAQVLRDLQKLHNDGVINDREYEAKKAEVLRRM